MPRRRTTVPCLYDHGVPTLGFNQKVYDWITGASPVREHARTAAFAPLLTDYDAILDAALAETIVTENWR